MLNEVDERNSDAQRFDVLIVGAGHAGSQAAMSLRQLGFAGTIALLSDEPDWPYERPPLSKDYLAGTKPFDAMLLKEPAYWAGKDITVLRSIRVVGVDPAARAVRTSDGAALGYGTLIWCAGGAPRRLSCAAATWPACTPSARAPTSISCARNWRRRPRWRWWAAAISAWRRRPC